jgi:glycosyltransferase involved in cell wall biosynthesis
LVEKAMTDRKGISVVICCYNSAARLPDTLGYLAQQEGRDSMPWEVLVIDNASTDETQQVARTSAEQLGIADRVRILFEGTPGQTFARHCGVQNSIYDLILFCDDDNHLDKNYLLNAMRLMREQPAAGIAGGWNRPRFPFQPGRWIEDQYTALAIGKRSEADNFVSWVFGAGMVVRRRVFETLASRGIAQQLSGRTDVFMGTGDDAELCILAQFVGFRIFYSNQLVLDHAISANRLNKRKFIVSNAGTTEPVIHLRVLDKLVAEPSIPTSMLFRWYLFEVLGLILSSAPRSILGRHQFFNFLILFQNLQIAWWLVSGYRRFARMALRIRVNLKGVDRASG